MRERREGRRWVAIWREMDAQRRTEQYLYRTILHACSHLPNGNVDERAIVLFVSSNHFNSPPPPPPPPPPSISTSPANWLHCRTFIGRHRQSYCIRYHLLLYNNDCRPLTVVLRVSVSESRTFFKTATGSSKERCQFPSRQKVQTYFYIIKLSLNSIYNEQ